MRWLSVRKQHNSGDWKTKVKADFQFSGAKLVQSHDLTISPSTHCRNATECTAEKMRQDGEKHNYTTKKLSNFSKMQQR